MDNVDLLLEIGTEEIPSGFLPPSLEAMREGMAHALDGVGLLWQGMETLATPRRMTVHVTGLPRQQTDRTRDVQGPPKTAAFSMEGAPTAAATGFARAQGCEVSDLEIRPTPRGDYVFAVHREMGRATRDVLGECLPRMIRDIPFAKSMRWGDGDLRFARPIHWIVALLDGEVVPFTLDGIPSGNESRGHRFHSPEPFMVTDFPGYLHALTQRRVFLDVRQRRDAIAEQLEALAQEVGGVPYRDPDLLETVTHLVEYPVAVRGSFPESYLTLPAAVLTTAMTQHQRFFPIQDHEGRLLPCFVGIANTEALDMATVRQGYERVLRARLADASFFFQEDRKQSLESRVPRLGGMVFQEQLGTVYDKTLRITALARVLAGELAPEAVEAASRAAYLAKADLLTEMVVEFPSLQGTMGREYARAEGEPVEVADAIAEHYCPRFSGDALPASPVGRVASLADKLDSLGGCFGIGVVPTGSEDPYALRRQANGVLQILFEADRPVSLEKLAQQAVSGVSTLIPGPSDTVVSQLLAFFRQRLSTLLLAEGHGHDVVEAVLGRQGDDPADARRRAEALSRVHQEACFSDLLAAYRRVARILPEDGDRTLDRTTLTEPAEQALYVAYLRLRGLIEAHLRVGRYLEALREMAGLREPVDRFFDNVLVMAPDPAVKRNRLALLGQVADLFLRVADLSALTEEGKKQD